MNYKRGVSSIIVVIIIVVLGGATFAIVNRSVLKSYFQTGDKPSQEQMVAVEDMSGGSDVPPAPNSTVGDKPTEAQFADTIDSDMSSAKAPAPQETLKNSKPATGTKLTQAEAEKSVLFSWGAVVPKSKESVTYRLKVWQLMQGQNASQAMRTNQPIVTKDVDNVTSASVSGLYTGPCKPPYLCEFVWSVATLSNGALSNSSAPSTFSVIEAPASLPIQAETHSETHPEVHPPSSDGSVR